MTGEQIFPTRMELIGVKERIALASKGYQLLKQKRDILLIELMAILHPALNIRDRLNEQMRKSYESLNGAQSHHSIIELESLAMSVSKTQTASVSVRNVMGVILPQVIRPQQARTLKDRGYSIPYSSAKVDEAAENFEKSLDLIMETAEKEVSMRKLLLEIEKTKRRVNALDYIVIPWLKESQSEITIKLDEMERDDLMTLKSVKRHLEQEATVLNPA